MEITIDKKTRIVTDEFSWIVQFKRKKPSAFKSSGHVKEWDNWGYFGSLRSAVQRLVEHKIRKIPYSDVERILGRIDKIQKEMSKGLKPYGIDVLKADKGGK